MITNKVILFSWVLSILKTDPPNKIAEKKSGCYRAVTWFCGYGDDSEEGQRKARAEEKRVRQITTSIEQDPRAKKFIHTNMIILLGVSVFLYTYFSVDWIWDVR